MCGVDDDDPGPDPTDPTDPSNYTTLGAMKFTRLGVGEWQVDLDVAGPTFLRYIAARVLFSTLDDVQAQVTVDPDLTVPPGSRLRVQVWDVSAGAGLDTPFDIQFDSALCIEAIVNQPGQPRFSTGPRVEALPVPAPMPPPPPDDDRPPPRIL